MSEFGDRYINPFTDYGFKRLFGEEPNNWLYVLNNIIVLIQFRIN